MHHFLRVPEILSRIFLEVFDPDDARRSYPFGSGSRTLVNLALTCKMFSEPALNILWRFLPNLVPLIRSLPPDALHVGVRLNEPVWVRFLIDFAYIVYGLKGLAIL